METMLQQMIIQGNTSIPMHACMHASLHAWRQAGLIFTMEGES